MKYRVTISREGDAWLADVPAVAGAHTYGRSIDQVLRSAREVIVLMADLPDDADIEFDLEYNFSDELVEKAFEIGRTRAELALRQEELTRQTAGVIHELNARGFAVRDSARLLDMTPGRVSQIANS